MKVIARDPLGVRALYYRDDGAFGPSLRVLTGDTPVLDPRGVRWAWGERGDATKSCVAHIARALPGEQRSWTGAAWRFDSSSLRGSEIEIDVEKMMRDSTERMLSRPGRAALCLSGGLDSALVLSWVLALGARPPVYVFSPRGTGEYDETARAVATARFFGIEPIIVTAIDEDFVAALPACVRDAETPLYNLHPVSKQLLARRLAADGFDVAYTGDGADHVFGGATCDDYLPIVGAITLAQGVRIASPFFDDEVIASRHSLAPGDPQKEVLRALARGVVPDDLVLRGKEPRLAPPFDLERYRDPTRLDRLARMIDETCTITSNRDLVKWVTLDLLVHALRVPLS